MDMGWAVASRAMAGTAWGQSAQCRTTVATATGSTTTTSGWATTTVLIGATTVERQLLDLLVLMVVAGWTSSQNSHSPAHGVQDGGLSPITSSGQSDADQGQDGSFRGPAAKGFDWDEALGGHTVGGERAQQ